jgi:hypothetical protein
VPRESQTLGLDREEAVRFLPAAQAAGDALMEQGKLDDAAAASSGTNVARDARLPG